MANDLPAPVRRLIAMKHQAILELELALTETLGNLDEAQARVAELEAKLEEMTALDRPIEDLVS